MIVKDDHETDFGEDSDGDVEDLHSCFADKFWVGSQVLRWNWFIVKEELKGVGQSDAVHLKFMPDIQGDISDGSEFEPID